MKYRTYIYSTYSANPGSALHVSQALSHLGSRSILETVLVERIEIMEASAALHLEERGRSGNFVRPPRVRV